MSLPQCVLEDFLFLIMCDCVGIPQLDGRSKLRLLRVFEPCTGCVCCLLVLFLIVYVIILLNILIALMSDTFNRIQSNGLAQWRLERCKIILEQLHLLTDEDSHIHTRTHTTSAHMHAQAEDAAYEDKNTGSDDVSVSGQHDAQYIHVLKRAEFVKPTNTSDEYHTRVMHIHKNTQEILVHNKRMEDQVYVTVRKWICRWVNVIIYLRVSTDKYDE
jgi:hypothetical protein